MNKKLKDSIIVHWKNKGGHFTENDRYILQSKIEFEIISVLRNCDLYNIKMDNVKIGELIEYNDRFGNKTKIVVK